MAKKFIKLSKGDGGSADDSIAEIISGTIKSVIIPTSVTTINQYAFAHCKSLASVIIPTSVTTINQYAFEGCTALAKAYYEGTETEWASVAFTSTGNTYLSNVLYYYSEGEPTTSGNYWHYVGGVPVVWERLPQPTLALDGDILTVTDGSGKATMYDLLIDGKIFATNEITSTATVTLSNFGLEAGRHSISAQTKAEGYVSSAISASVSYYVEGALSAGIYDANDVRLATWDELINDYGMNPTGTFTNKNYNTTTTSPYYVLTNNSEFATASKLIIGDITSIGAYTFYKCERIATLIIPFGIKTIGDYAFSSCPNLTSVSISGSVTTINRYAFYMSGLTGDLIIPDSVKSIGDYALGACDNLAKVFIEGTVTTMGGNIFYSCDGLTDVTINGGILGKYAFENCKALVNVTLCEGVTSIGASAFTVGYNGTALRTITIPHSVTKIGNHAFSTSQITQVIFVTPNGWWYASSETDTSGTAIPSTDFEDSSIAAQKLKSTSSTSGYGGKYLFRS